MYNQPFFIPSYQMYNMPLNMGNMASMSNMAGMGNVANMARTAAPAARGLGLFSRIGNTLGGLRSINWGGLINNTSKTLGIINQTIPLVKQVGPMVTNVRSMLRLVSVFKDETDTPQKINTTSTQKQNINHSNSDIRLPNHNIQKNILPPEKEKFSSDNSPTFFINT